MRLQDAILGVEYRLKPVNVSVNMAFKDARVVVTRITGRDANIRFWQTSGNTGDTEIQLYDTNWEIEPIVKDWDI